MADEQSEFWSKVAQQYDHVVDLQIGPQTRSMVRERVAKEGRLGNVVVIANLDPRALSGLDRLRCLIRIFYHGLTGYRAKPPKGFGKQVMTERQLCDLLGKSGLEVVSTETVRDASRSSNIPVEYIRAVKVLTSTSGGTGYLRQ